MSSDILSAEGLLARADRLLHYQLFVVNDTPITLASLVIFIVLFIGMVVVSRIASGLLATRVLARLGMAPQTAYNVRRITFYLLALLSAVLAFQFIGIDLSGLAVIFGLLSVGIGFGLQNVTSNFISGIILLFERPIRLGDRVTVGETLGDVVAINMRATTIPVAAERVDHRAEFGVRIVAGDQLVAHRSEGAARYRCRRVLQQ